jgi:hypothetical protein
VLQLRLLLLLLLRKLLQSTNAIADIYCREILKGFFFLFSFFLFNWSVFQCFFCKMFVQSTHSVFFGSLVFASIEFHVYLQLEDFLSRGKIKNSATIDHQLMMDPTSAN